MGIFVFLTAAIVEITLALFCIITKSEQRKAKSIIRIAELAGFVLLIVLGILDRSIRYVSLLGLLLLLSGIGSVVLIRRREGKRAYKALRVVFKAIGLIALFFVFTLPAILFPQNKALETTGAFEVATVQYTYTDASRTETYSDTGENRKLNVQMWYPQNSDGTGPLIVFSHGGFGIKTSNQSLYRELASHGYVVCAIDHTYQCLYTTDKDGHTTLLDNGYMRECAREDARTDRQQSFAYYQKWMKVRTEDINFVIETIRAQAEKSNADTVYRLVDTTKIGVMGHSLGGSAALGIGRMRSDVGAVIALESPFLCDIEGVKDGEFVFAEEGYPVPVLNVYSDSGWKLLPDRPQYAENYDLLSGSTPSAFNVHIRGTGHFTLTDLALESPILTRMLNGQKSTADTEYCLRTLNKLCLDFFDCYLKGKGSFTPNGVY